MRRSSRISSRNREGYRGLPSRFRPSASDRYSPFCARVMATKHSRRSSSMPGMVRVFFEGKMPSFIAHRNTYGNSRPFALWTVMSRT